MKQPWYEHSGDTNQPEKEPMRYLSLKHRIWDLHRKSKGGIIEPVPTADPVDVEADFRVRAVVWDPYLAVYGAKFNGEAVTSLIASRWRKVVAESCYFAKKEEDQTTEDELEINTKIQEVIHLALNSDFGLLCQEVDNGDKEKKFLRPSLKEESGKVIIESDFPKQSPAEQARDHYGFLVLDIEITDIQIADDKVW